MGTNPDVWAVAPAAVRFAPSAQATATPTQQRVRWGRILLIAVAGVVSHTFGRGTISLLLPAMSEDLGLSVSVAGALGSVNFGSYFAGVVAVTFLAGRIEPTSLLRAGIAVSASGLGVLGIATNTNMVIVGTALAGLGGAGIWLTAPLIATDGVPAHRRGVAVGVLTATMGAAFVGVPIFTTVGRNLVDNDTLWRPIWLGEFVIAALLLVLISSFIRATATEQTPAAGGFRALRQLNGWKRTVIAYMSFGYVTASFGQFLGLALEQDHGFSREAATLVFTPIGVGSLVGALVFGRLSDWLGRRPTMALVMFAVAGCAVAVIVGSATVVVVAAAAFGATSFAYPSLTATLVRDHVNDRTFSAVFGAMTIFYGPASAISPTVSGQLADATGSFASSYLVIAALALLAALCMAIRPGNSSRRAA